MTSGADAAAPEPAPQPGKAPRRCFRLRSRKHRGELRRDLAVAARDRECSGGGPFSRSTVPLALFALARPLRAARGKGTPARLPRWGPRQMATLACPAVAARDHERSEGGSLFAPRPLAAAQARAPLHPLRCGRRFVGSRRRGRFARSGPCGAVRRSVKENGAEGARFSRRSP